MPVTPFSVVYGKRKQTNKTNQTKPFVVLSSHGYLSLLIVNYCQITLWVIN